MHSGRPTLAQIERMNVLHGTCTSQHIGRHALRATYPRSASLGFPRIARSVALGCPRIARSDGLECSRMASVGWPRMPSVLGRAWYMQSFVARREDMTTYGQHCGFHLI
ncbi:hypothetical protein F3Y22_tig00112523pilonHSYRG00015 [Hibiscus syriacus]|uniref:Uncharacterized protein n=1 Tax=Hibiscus syriacus TaxID=106335 RepID=A0A6A2XV26_HIBSY|nr:hypothetical protein F3Y22_tig00112523pilonHSYRG00015 [Hibiscus syriacus]